MSEQADSPATKAADEYRRQQMANDFTAVMSTPHGRRFMYHLLDYCRVFQASMAQDDRTTCFNEGRRNVGLKHLQQINELAPGEYQQMMEDHAEFERRVAQHIDHIEDENDGD